MFPRAAMDDTILMAPPSYQFLVPMPRIDVCNQFPILGKQDSTNKSYREIRNPSGPKNCEETVLVDAIKLLKNLTSQL
jgi:hypothetical protein